MSRSVMYMADNAKSMMDGAMTLREIEEFCVEARSAGATPDSVPRANVSMQPKMNAQGAAIRTLAWKKGD